MEKIYVWQHRRLHIMLLHGNCKIFSFLGTKNTFDNAAIFWMIIPSFHQSFSPTSSLITPFPQFWEQKGTFGNTAIFYIMLLYDNSSISSNLRKNYIWKHCILSYYFFMAITPVPQFWGKIHLATLKFSILCFCIIPPYHQILRKITFGKTTISPTSSLLQLHHFHIFGDKK